MNDAVKAIAEKLHEELCNGNHIDVCDWSYGSWGEPSYAHRRWYRYAEALEKHFGDAVAARTFVEEYINAKNLLQEVMLQR